jgi:hypothetical protein
VTRARWAITPIVAAIVVAGVAIGCTAIPTGGLPLVGRAVLKGELTPDVAEGVNPETLPRSPNGEACLDPIVRPAGPMSLCWAAYRDPHDADPDKDYYRFRVHGTFGGQSGSGVRWATVRVRLVGEPLDNVFKAWPDSVIEGPCRQLDVQLGVGPVQQETLCGRTAGASSSEGWSHTVTWTCEVCPDADHADRSIALQEFIGVAAGTVPTWEIFADLGS